MHVVRCSEGILNWSDQELRAMDVKARKRTMFGVFHRVGSLVRLYMERKDGRRGLISEYHCVTDEECGLSGYVKLSEFGMWRVVVLVLHRGSNRGGMIKWS